MIFQSFAYNEVVKVIGPRDLNSTNVWNLTTPNLEKCFYEVGEGTPLSWYEFASDIGTGNYERFPMTNLTTVKQESGCLSYFGMI
jgi:hypothetical protein